MIKRKRIAKAREEFKIIATAELMLREAIIKKSPLIYTVKGVQETAKQRERIDYKLKIIEELYKYPFALVHIGYGEVYLILEDNFAECKELTKKLETLLATNAKNDNGLLYIVDVEVADDESIKDKQIRDIAFEALTALEAMSVKLQPKNNVEM